MLESARQFPVCKLVRENQLTLSEGVYTYRLLGKRMVAYISRVLVLVFISTRISSSSSRRSKRRRESSGLSIPCSNTSHNARARFSRCFSVSSSSFLPLPLPSLYTTTTTLMTTAARQLKIFLTPVAGSYCTAPTLHCNRHQRHFTS